MPSMERLKWYGVLAIGVSFSAGGLAMIVTGGQHGWVVFLFFAFCAAMAVHELWPRVIEGDAAVDTEDLLRRFPGPVKLHVPRRKIVFFGVSSIIFGGCLAFVALRGDLSAFENFWLWLGAAGCAAACPVFALMIFRGSTLRLGAEGFQLYQGLKRNFHRWADASEFSVADAGVLSPATNLMVVFDDAKTIGGKVAAFNRSLLGRSSALPDTYGMDVWELASFLNAWRQRALSAAGATSKPEPLSRPAP